MECDKSSAVTFFDIFLFCKIMIFDTPLIEDASAPTVDCRSYPATKMSTSPPIFVAAVTVARIPEETMKKYRVTTWERQPEIQKCMDTEKRDTKSKREVDIEVERGEDRKRQIEQSWEEKKETEREVRKERESMRDRYIGQKLDEHVTAEDLKNGQ